MDCKQTFVTNASYHGIHLDYGCFQTILKKLLKIRIASSYTTSPINLKFGLFVTRTIFNLTRKIDIPDIEQLGIHIIIKCLFVAH
jgi:hypothetical protein